MPPTPSANPVHQLFPKQPAWRTRESWTWLPEQRHMTWEVNFTDLEGEVSVHNTGGEETETSMGGFKVTIRPRKNEEEAS